MTTTVTDGAAPPAELDPLGFPLHGSRLIEASAGTGKTFTIALLYVRLVLGARHAEDAAAFHRPLTPPEILVVTFTNAATQELRERIRARLVEAAEVFLQSDDTADPLLITLRDEYDPASWPAGARRLQLAAEWMDEAAVSTIHSWCYRMLREHAFDSGSLFSLDLEPDQTELELEVVRDYWRSFYYPLPGAALDVVDRHWEKPEDLHDDLRALLPLTEALPQGIAPPAETIARTETAIRERLAELKAPWPTWADELAALFDEGQKRKAFNAQKLNTRNRGNWLAALREWSQSDARRPGLSDAAWQRLTPEGIAEIWKDAPPAHPAFDAIAALPSELAALPEPRADLLTHAAHWCRERLEREQQRRAEMGPNELMTHLDRALRGANCEALGAQIRRQFPVALVDEFQDTDPVQYRIFDCVYRIAENRPETGVFLIGDPKQAIYAFRGADIHTYLQARRDTAGRHVTLGTNYRSSAPMVAAVNRCFDVAEQHPPGAFLFRSRNEDPVPFQPVKAKGRKERLVVDGEPQPALTLWQLDADEPLARTTYRLGMAERCASRMAALLEQGQRGRAGFREGGDGGDLRPLRPGDMAVLVNGLSEARAIRRALARRGIKSVYLSDRDQVFAAAVAGELESWLRACADPDDDAALRAALATPSLGLGLAELDALNEDELAWEDRVVQFRDYHRQWRDQGVLALLRRLMNDFDVPARLLDAAHGHEGERALTDLLHLGEVLQHASQELDGEHALIRFLAESRADPNAGGADTHRLRLESDADLVQVITIHKSKGLEYPLVFLPFICSHRPLKPDDTPLRWHDDRGRLRIALEGDEATLAAADRERLGEDLRKLYVALTRARHATWAGLAPLKGLEASAIGHLLTGGTELAPEAFGKALATLRGDCEAIALEPAPAVEERAIALDDAAGTPGEARIPARAAREHWWIASYSALTFSTHADARPEMAASAPNGDAIAAPQAPLPEPATPLEATAIEVIEEPRDSATTTETAPSLHRFPRGPGPGTFLHGLLEWAGQQGFGWVLANPAALEDTLARRCNVRGWTAWVPTLHEWLTRLLATPLPLPDGDTLRLDALNVYQVELEFWFAAHRVDTRALDDAVRRHTLGRLTRPRADRDMLNGMLKGFIDLVFERDGRYYVADWKSNHLGPDDAAYTPEALAVAIAGKRYDLQYALYLLALHRLLTSRLPDYDYDRHIGGSLTVFLRGANAPGRGVHAERPPRELIEALDALFQGDARPAATEATA
ncbi:exodeoxyribonuclease V subunit beta [Modicisalibacter sp. 'Wilcox']|uniref:exodeoxyribonuclease V subunit beta n=1 Tax=Modicisalibacter sp. 'Wilcox' TaxID=2679914 RepID=UPI0013D09A61|nr:exodeoxyribonuclease V subunit beta [Modicisalibacter sp. 'Wilcox']